MNINIPQELKTKRLIIRPVSPKYAQEVYESFTSEVTTYMYPKPSVVIKETRDYLSGAERKNEANKNYEVLIFEKDSNEFLGGGGLFNIDTATPELGIWIKKAAHGHGYGREAVAALNEWAREYLNHDYLKYPVDRDNVPSRKIPESLAGVMRKEYSEKSESGKKLNIIEYHIYK